jgi:hypothetical protein
MREAAVAAALKIANWQLQIENCPPRCDALERQFFAICNLFGCVSIPAG